MVKTLEIKVKIHVRHIVRINFFSDGHPSSDEIDVSEKRFNSLKDPENIGYLKFFCLVRKNGSALRKHKKGNFDDLCIVSVDFCENWSFKEGIQHENETKWFPISDKDMEKETINFDLKEKCKEEDIISGN